MSWETVIGLEVHAQLATKSKMFSAAATEFGAAANTQACAIDLGLPGVLPTINAEAIQMACKFGMAIDGKVASLTMFSRKNYFYPDLPKGYQISQYESPIVSQGHLNIVLDNQEIKKINIERAHLEEDAGKSVHENFHGVSGIDLNRAGVPLLEIVSAPDLRSANEAIAYLKTLHTLIRYLEISDANMQEGSFRCDVNISMRRAGTSKLGTRAEIKNLNSFRFIEKAIQFEVARQISLLEAGKEVVQETRLFDSVNNKTITMRSKEEANDYRYFDDPDLPPVAISKDMLAQIKATLPELPWNKKSRFQQQFELSYYDASVLTQNKELATYYEDALQQCTSDNIKNYAKILANWITTELLGMLNKNNLTIQDCPVPAKQMGILVMRIVDNTISGKIAKNIFAQLWEKPAEVDQIIDSSNLKQMTDTSELTNIIQNILAENSNQVAAFKNGKTKLFGFFVGNVMKATQGKANPQTVTEILKKLLQ